MSSFYHEYWWQAGAQRLLAFLKDSPTYSEMPLQGRDLVPPVRFVGNFCSRTFCGLTHHAATLPAPVGARRTLFCPPWKFDDGNDSGPHAPAGNPPRAKRPTALRKDAAQLLVSLFRRGAKKDTTRAAKLEEFCADRLDLFQKLDWESLVEAAAAYTPQAEEERAASGGDFAALRAQWEAQRVSTIERASLPQAQAVTAIAQRVKGQPPSVPAEEDLISEKAEAGEGESPYRRGRGGTNLGRAVHAVLQSIDLLTGEGLEDICRAQAEAEGIGDAAKEVLELSRNALATETVKGLIESVKQGSANYYREVFVSTKLGDRLVEGFIDLLIDAPDGITIVDYKTDRLTIKQVQELGPEYEVQLGLYAWAVEETTGKPMREATLLFLRPQEERRFPDPQALILKALDAAKV